MKPDGQISLKKALETGRLGDFIRQEEKRGVEPVSEAEFDRAVRKLSRPPQSKDRT
jgi:hypothetical protein